MKTLFSHITVGAEYERPQLAKLWGYKAYQAIAKGIVTPAGTPYIILFVTEEKQAFLTQYKDKLEGDILYMEGETEHVNDRRLVNAENYGDEIHLFHRKIHHTPFTYYGRVNLVGFTLKSDQPSRFVFSVGAKSTLLTDLEQSFLRRQSSYKIVAILALLDIINGKGAAQVGEVTERFANFYINRFKRGLVVENNGLTMNRIADLDQRNIKNILLKNPVTYLSEFVIFDEYSQEIVFKEEIWEKLNDKMIASVQRLAIKHLNDYYRDFDALDYEEDDLPNLFKDDFCYIDNKESEFNIICNTNQPPSTRELFDKPCENIKAGAGDSDEKSVMFSSKGLNVTEPLNGEEVFSSQDGLADDLLPEFFQKVVEPIALAEEINIDDIATKLDEWRGEERLSVEQNELKVKLKQSLDLLKIRQEEVKRLLELRRELKNYRKWLIDTDEIDNDTVQANNQDYEQRKEEFALIEGALKKLHLGIDVCRKQFHHYTEWAGRIKKFAADDFVFDELYESALEASEITIKLEQDYWRNIGEANKLLEKMNERVILHDSDRVNDIRTIWVRLSKLLQQSRMLKGQLSSCQAERDEVKLKKQRPKTVLWAGLLMLIVGLGLVVVNPMEYMFWLLISVGAITTVVGLKRVNYFKPQVNGTPINLAATRVDVSDVRNEIVSCYRELDKLFEEFLETTGESKHRIKAIVAVKKGLESKQDDVLQMLEESEAALAHLVDDVSEAGRTNNNKQQSIKLRIAQLERELEGRGKYPFPSELLKKNEDQLELKQSELSEVVVKTNRKLDVAIKEQEVQTKTMPSMPAAISRFLLQGGEVAQVWLVETVRLYLETAAGATYTINPETPLPDKVVDAFLLWWIEQGDSPTSELKKQKQPPRRRLSAPEIKLDPIGEIHLFFPIQRFDSGDDSAGGWVKLYNSTNGQELYRKALPVYKRKSDLYETEALEFPLFVLADEIKVELIFGQHSIQTWNIKLMKSEAVPVLIFDLEGNIFLKEPLSRKRMWFVMRNGLSVKNSVEPLEEAPVYLEEHFYMQLIDLNKVSDAKLCIADQQGSHLYYGLIGNAAVGPELIGKEVAGLKVNEIHPLYLKADLELHIPAVDLNELNGWIVEVWPKERSPGRVLRSTLKELDEVLKYNHSTSTAILLLSETPFMIEEKCGSYLVNIFNPKGQQFVFDISFIDYFEYSYLNWLYFQKECGTNNLELNIRCPEKVLLTDGDPVEILMLADDTYHLHADYVLDHIRVILNWNSATAGNIKLPVTIVVPKLRWRIYGSEDKSSEQWCNQIDELWIGDWHEAQSLSLHVGIPCHLKGKVRLELAGAEQFYEAELKNGAARFNLLPFIDTLRTIDSVADFQLTVKNGGLKENSSEVTLFRLRTKWVVEDFAIEQEVVDSGKCFVATWRDCGTAEGRILQFWDKNQPFNPPVFEKQIPDDVSKLIFEATWQSLPEGSYLVSFTLDDPWSATDEIAHIPLKVDNHFSCVVYGDNPIFEDVQLEWLGEHLSVRGRIHNADHNCIFDAVVIGYREGEWVNWTSTGQADDIGVFCLEVDAVRTVARWLGLKTRSTSPAYYYILLPSPSPLGINLEDNSLAAFKIGDGAAVNVEMYWELGIYKNLPLRVLEGGNMLQALAEGNKNIQFSLEMTDGSKKEAKLVLDHLTNKMTLMLQEGIVCTSCDCGKIFGNVKEWYTHSSWQESPSCKSFIYNFNEINAKVTAIWDIAPYLEQAKNLSPLFTNVLLFSNTQPLIADNLLQKFSDPVLLSSALLSQEIAWLDRLFELDEISEEG